MIKYLPHEKICHINPGQILLINYYVYEIMKNGFWHQKKCHNL